MSDRKDKKGSRARNLAGIVLIVVLLSAPAFATTVARLTLEQLVQSADLIVQGRVESVESQWDQQRRLIFTYISIRVDEPLKGGNPQSVVVRQVGGIAGAIQMSIAGAPQFKSGESAIVFLKHLDGGVFQVVGMNQGLYEIIDNVAVANLLGVDMLDTKTGEITRPLIGGRAPLDQLKTKIRELLK